MQLTDIVIKIEISFPCFARMMQRTKEINTDEVAFKKMSIKIEIKFSLIRINQKFFARPSLKLQLAQQVLSL